MAFLLDTMAVATDGFIVRGTIVVGGQMEVTVQDESPKIEATVRNPTGKIEVIVKKCDV